MKNSKLLIFGPPGSGKGTLSDFLAEREAIIHISTGDIFREHLKANDDIAHQIKDLSNGGLVPDELTNSIVKERLSRDDVREGFVLDGYPRTLNQALFLEGFCKIKGVIFVDLEDDKIISRISHRRVCPNCGKVYNLDFNKPKVEGVCDVCHHELIQRVDDKPEVVKERLRIYKSETMPILRLFERQKISLIHIRGDYDLKEVSKVVDRINDWLVSLKE